MSVLAPVSGRLSDARGRRLPALMGAVFQVLATLLLLVGVGVSVSSLYLAGALAVLGTGSGLGTGAATTAAVESAPLELAGSAAGTMSMMRYFGSIVGAGALGGILSAGGGPPDIAVFRVLFAGLLVMALASLACSTLIHKFVTEADLTPIGRQRANG